MIKNFFPTPVSFSKINIDNRRLSEEVYTLLEHNKNQLKSGVNGYRIDINQTTIDNNELLIGDLLSKIQTKISNYCNSLNIVNQRIIQSWININPTNAYNKKHCHPNSYISGAYYINVPKDCNSPITFFRSREYKDYGWQSISLDKNLDYTSEINYMPHTSDLILFPSFLEHDVGPNMSESQDRISLSFNTHI